ncbi:MAG: tetratricopeptide repeat protein [Chitinivibrionales bacterium]|nr:tetratricopeptide repeat protein [Chitinivibrionales bacterium]MBD3395852.1 tetratricopeptide repeat protein [Chitinivibrionales bacterium]
MRLPSARKAFLILALAAAQMPAAPVEQWFETANSAYRKQEYDTAGAYYEKILDTGLRNAAVFFNLGNVYYRKNKIGLAVLYYEKARELAPTDPDVLANIRFARKHIVDRVPEPARGFVDTIVWRLHTWLTLHAQLWVVWIMLAALSAMFCTGLFVSRNARLWLMYLACLAGLVTILLGISAGIKIYQKENTRKAVVLEKAVDARNQPDGGKILFTAHEGTTFRIRKQNGDWYLVSLPNGVSGWVEIASLGEI